jgi:hypothetical protein
MQKRMVEIKKQTKAAHSKPNAYVPMFAFWPLFRKLFRPLTCAVLRNRRQRYFVECERLTYVMRATWIAWKKAAVMVSRPLRYAPILVHKASRPVKRAITAKKRAISINENMNRVMRK